MTDTIESLQLENQKLKDQNKTLSGWISLISHDTKQIFGNIQWLIEAYEDASISQEDFLKMVPQIRKDATKNFQTAQDTGEWLKTQYGEFSPRPDSLKASDIYTELLQVFKDRLLQKDLSIEFLGDAEIIFVTDKILLNFILTKTIDNAIKYSHKSGKILLDISEKSDEIIISISDSGIGMTESNLDSIYSFENSVFEGTEGEIGAGLSLKIVQYFVGLIGGSIQIKSLQSIGSIVSIRFPKIIK